MCRCNLENEIQSQHVEGFLGNFLDFISSAEFARAAALPRSAAILTVLDEVFVRFYGELDDAMRADCIYVQTTLKVKV